MNNKINLTVIIPYYNKINFFKKTVLSLENQTYKKFKVLIIYDDKYKNDLEKIRKIIKNKKNYKIIVNKKNIGAGKSRNKAINFVTTEYIAFLDSDDLWHKDKARYQIKFMQKKKIMFSFTSYNIISSKDKIINKMIAKNKLSYNDILKSCDIALSTVMIHSKIKKFVKFGELKTKEDYICWLGIIKKNINAFGIKKCLSSWRKSSNSLSSSQIQKLIDAFRVYYVYEKFNLIYSIYFTLRLSLNYLLKHYLKTEKRV
jgi:teichuronic acid biosynthesis glycosyltransferase TuaG